MIVKFYRDPHRYYAGDKKLESVSGYVGKFRKKFDSDLISSRIALKEIIGKTKYNQILKDNKYDERKTVDQIIKTVDQEKFKKNQEAELNAWKNKNNKSTKFHDKKESLYLEQGYKINPFDNKRYDIPQCVYDKLALDCENVTPVENIADLPEGYYPELLVYDLELGVAGQIDEAFILQSPFGKYVDIDDYKTDTSIWTKSIWDKRKRGYTMMNFPLDHLMDTNKHYYELKISQYARFLDKNGIKPRNLAFTHYDRDTGEFKKRYTFDYKIHEIKLMKKYYKNFPELIGKY